MRKMLSNVKAVLGAEQRYVPRPVDVVIEGERIAAVVAGGSATDGERVPLDGCLLVPGLVNGHQHSHEHFHKGRLENLPLELWMHYVRAPRPARLTPRQAYLRTMVCALEALRSCATTLVDDVSLGQSIDPATVEAIFQAYEDAGIRALVGFSMMDRAIVDNFPDVDTRSLLCWKPDSHNTIRTTTGLALRFRLRRRSAARLNFLRVAARLPMRMRCR
ncbi:cytosine/adenosine deaminase-related metal-dependent hydrolase [Paraburkholderia sp. 40]